MTETDSTDLSSSLTTTGKSGGKVGFVSLGCPKALVDTENIVGELLASGYEAVGDYTDADVVVVNTCGFIDDAVAESLATIEQALEANGRVIVTGCLGARPEVISEQFPEVLHISGPQAVAEVTDAVKSFEPLPPTGEPLMSGLTERALLTPPHYAYLKISEGCNHRCSFCIIPSMRGKLKSRDIATNLEEAAGLAAAGVRELLVVSQDTSAYGVDLKYQTRPWQGRELRSDLVTLCRELGQMFDWVRLHYVYPYPNVDDLIPLMAEGLVLPYLDVPLQHADPTVLQAMRRPAASDKTLARINEWRTVCPELKLRSTFIVGFPGETEAQFESLLRFLQEARLDRVGAFAYSDVDGAAAQQIAPQLPESVKAERLERLMATQAEISASRLGDWVGLETQVLVDSVTADDDGVVALARTYADAPEIDGSVFVRDAGGLQPGDFAWVHVDSATEHDLYAQALGDPLNFD